jgi:hypothetical protein
MSAVFQGISDVILSVNAVAGAGAFISLIGGKSTLFAQILIGVVAAASAVDRALNFSKKSKRHYDLCRRFTELAATLENWDATDANLRKAKSRRVQIEGDEPPVKRLIDIVSRNEELRSRGYPPENFAPVSILQSSLGYFITFGMPRLNRWRDVRATEIAASNATPAKTISTGSSKSD